MIDRRFSKYALVALVPFGVLFGYFVLKMFNFVAAVDRYVFVFWLGSSILFWGYTSYKTKVMLNWVLVEHEKHPELFIALWFFRIIVGFVMVFISLWHWLQ
ncbi:MAG: hypothetical protein C0621_04700 [Desulfuromonas sp.]|nr:MAG: hypothetical protein C0621_04700 [Desulfuromonas sp.]